MSLKFWHLQQDLCLFWNLLTVADRIHNLEYVSIQSIIKMLNRLYLVICLLLFLINKTIILSFSSLRCYNITLIWIANFYFTKRLWISIDEIDNMLEIYCWKCLLCFIFFFGISFILNDNRLLCAKLINIFNINNFWQVCKEIPMNQQRVLMCNYCIAVNFECCSLN